MPNHLRKQLREFFQRIGETLDISEDRYKHTEERYQAITSWLSRGESIVRKFNPDIYPQGSFRLGTVIKPITDAEEYDIDLVCELSLTKGQVSQKQLKDWIGHEIKGYARANNMNSSPENGRRCWTLNYADGAQFHMDILPALPDGDSFRSFLEEKGFSAEWTDASIAITDDTLPNYERIDDDWLRSNPRGYTEWFKERMKIQFETRRKYLAESMQVSIESVPEYKIKTPLQRAIQILKRHRDIMFPDDPGDKPISIIITTLAAHAYDNEDDLLDALVNIVNDMPNHIQTRDSVSWVPNPVDPTENFADKWPNHPQREINFRKWLKQVRIDLTFAMQKGDIHEIGESLKSCLGKGITDEALKFFSQTIARNTSQLVTVASQIPSPFNARHRQKPIWPVKYRYSVSVSAFYKYNGNKNPLQSDSTPLPKDCDLFFSAKTNVPQPLKVYWQVVNTGTEAERNNQLRGDIFLSKIAGIGGLNQKESTAYTGMHWIECFIVKDGVCMARSREFVINIE